MARSLTTAIRAPARRWLPRRTVRLRLTALYGGLFLLTAAVLLAIIYILVAGHFQPTSVTVKANRPLPPEARAVPTGTQVGRSQLHPLATGDEFFVARSGGQVLGSFGPPGTVVADAAKTIKAAIGVQQSQDRSQLLMWSALALALMAIASIVLGWLVAGRVLAPLRTMTARARRISADSLDARLALRGPDDELKELGDTIDGLLARLERAFDAQRRFVANASHELRTPLTLERAMLEVALADPSSSEASLRAACERVLAASAEQERLITALLDLARSERGLDHSELVNLSGTVARALDAAPLADGVTVTSALEPACLSGDPRLAERLTGNLVENAVVHNVPGGWVRVATATEAGRAVLRVSNSGPVLGPGEVDGLLEPFRRGAGRVGRRGQGLGLSIVAAIVAAHDAELNLRAQPDGGLDVEVTFAPVPPALIAAGPRRASSGDHAAETEALMPQGR
jgi:signal transduction histidine kinase